MFIPWREQKSAERWLRTGRMSAQSPTSRKQREKWGTRQGHTDIPDTTSLHLPSIGLIVPGHVVYNQCRMYVGDTTPESRKNWIAALDRLAALNPAMVVAGQKKPGAPDSPSTIQDTKRYLQGFDRVQKTATSDQELFDQMTELYPHWVANQSWLMFGFPQP
jgi:hypothetical protein